MPRTKGDGLGKTGGRKKGTRNKISPETRDVLKEIYDNNVEGIQARLDLIVDPKDWLTIMIKIMEFVRPKMASQTITAEGRISDLRSEIEEMSKREID